MNDAVYNVNYFINVRNVTGRTKMYTNVLII